MTNPRICAIDGCGKAHAAKGWCNAHYQRWLKHSSPLGGTVARGAAFTFLEGAVLPFTGQDCLIWPFAKSSDGYGLIRYNGKMRRVHRIICEIEHGPPPTPGHHAAHLCGKGHLGCVNRRHLEWKTRAENEADKLIHGTHSRGERHGAAELTEAQVLEIRASTKSQRALAKQFGVSPTHVSKIKTRKNWACLDAA